MPSCLSGEHAMRMCSAEKVCIEMRYAGRAGTAGVLPTNVLSEREDISAQVAEFYWFGGGLVESYRRHPSEVSVQDFVISD